MQPRIGAMGRSESGLQRASTREATASQMVATGYARAAFPPSVPCPVRTQHANLAQWPEASPWKCMASTPTAEPARNSPLYSSARTADAVKVSPDSDERGGYLLRQQTFNNEDVSVKRVSGREAGVASVRLPLRIDKCVSSTVQPKPSSARETRATESLRRQNGGEPPETRCQAQVPIGTAAGSASCFAGDTNRLAGYASEQHSLARSPQPMDSGIAVTSPSKSSAVVNLKARSLELQRSNAELERRLDEHGNQFLEAMLTLEAEIEELNKQNRRLTDERTITLDQLKKQGCDGKLLAENLKQEREYQDMLREIGEFKKERIDEIKLAREEAESLRLQSAEQDRQMQQRLADLEVERNIILETYTEEGRELQARVDKLNREKEALSLDLAKALAKADVAACSKDDKSVGPHSAKMMGEVTKELRSATCEREALKDEVTEKEGQIVLLRSQLVIREQKLRHVDMENSILRSELEVYRTGSGCTVPAARLDDVGCKLAMDNTGQGDPLLSTPRRIGIPQRVALAHGASSSGGVRTMQPVG
eukprot:TRINITY_DN23721_c0_g1_i1.p1 TRINITY_DN23721_c0_g1~~TRINITY_DN23721_c0_g1_i1.p1  ORF type:complete len:538 (+),score=85.68 TRINITY_DN23721_c0_g1_i1:89-1702(+)